MDNLSTDQLKVLTGLLRERGASQENDQFTAEKISQVLQGARSLIALCGDDYRREGLEESPYRFLKAYLEYTQGYGDNPLAHLQTTFAAENSELVIVRDIEFYSVCEHHFAPFFGHAQIAYLPAKRITGLSKIARLVEGYARRFQVQERLTTQIATAIAEALTPQGVLVLLKAKHMCMCARGIQKSEAKTVTMATRGLYAHDSEQRALCLRLMDNKY